MTDFVAKAEIDVAAPVDQVWHALTDPDSIEEYFFGAKVDTDWRPGSPIVWRGQYQRKPFEDKGKILTVEDNRVLRMTHFSPLERFGGCARELPHARVQHSPIVRRAPGSSLARTTTAVRTKPTVPPRIGRRCCRGSSASSSGDGPRCRRFESSPPATR